MTPKRLVLWGMFVAYIAFLVDVMVFKHIPIIYLGHLMLNFGGIEHTERGNFIPFKTILPYLLGYKGWIIAGINLGANIALLVPIGLLLPLLYTRISWKGAFTAAVISGFLIETMQVLFQIGIFDIDDVILNALGVMVGYWIYRGIKYFAHE